MCDAIGVEGIERGQSRVAKVLIVSNYKRLPKIYNDTAVERLIIFFQKFDGLTR